ncbi:hypothetical protein, partial [Salmonella enterica]|uniref:hypothetical protein n=1 Tax=Salmonella enterica TaxID=28901 RepID=UPI003CF4679E
VALVQTTAPGLSSPVAASADAALVGRIADPYAAALLQCQMHSTCCTVEDVQALRFVDGSLHNVRALLAAPAPDL